MLDADLEEKTNETEKLKSVEVLDVDVVEVLDADVEEKTNEIEKLKSLEEKERGKQNGVRRVAEKALNESKHVGKRNAQKGKKVRNVEGR